MRVSVPLRIFLVHLVFTVGAGTAAVYLVRHSFQSYFRQWEREVSTLPAEQLFQPIANEAARSLLKRIEEDYPEVAERDQTRISEGLNAVLAELPSIEALLVLDRDLRIAFANQTSVVDLAFTDAEEKANLFASRTVRRRLRSDGRGGEITEVMVPILDVENENPDELPERLGSLLIWYRPDAALNARLPADLTPPSISPGDFMWPVVLFIAAAAAGGVLIALVTGFPVRRLEDALREFRERGFRGGLDADKLGLDGKLATTVQAINEMGGKLEAMDERGRERESLLATLAQSLEDGMLALDPNGSPTAWNDAALRILIPSDDFEEGEEADEVDAAERIRVALDRCPELSGSGLDPGGAAQHEVSLREGENGRRVTVQVTQVPFELGPERVGTLLLLRDLSALRKVEDHLLEAGRFAVLAHLAGSLAHEIRNPLHSIGVNAGVVEQYLGSPTTESGVRAMSESLSTIRSETGRLTDLVNHYLGLLRASPTEEPVDIEDLCRRVVKLLSYSALTSHVQIRMEGEAVPPVLGMPDRLQQAILNLALNAIQAMPEGGLIRIRTSCMAGLVRVTVADTGPGLPDHVASQLFHSRVTSKPGGSGLGLPIVRMITEAHGGSVWYRSTPGKGASFTVVLPAHNEQVETTPAARG